MKTAAPGHRNRTMLVLLGLTLLSMLASLILIITLAPLDTARSVPGGQDWQGFGTPNFVVRTIPLGAHLPESGDADRTAALASLAVVFIAVLIIAIYCYSKRRRTISAYHLKTPPAPPPLRR